MINNNLNNDEYYQKISKELSEIPDWYVIYKRKDIDCNIYFFTKGEIELYYTENYEKECLESLDMTLFQMTDSEYGKLVSEEGKWGKTKILNRRKEKKNENNEK